jgi:hypothetical protein
MQNRGRPTISKRNREQARRERNQAKAERREQRAAARRERADAPPGEDPDIAGIVPGPQPPPED